MYKPAGPPPIILISQLTFVKEVVPLELLPEQANRRLVTRLRNERRMEDIDNVISDYFISIRISHSLETPEKTDKPAI